MSVISPTDGVKSAVGYCIPPLAKKAPQTMTTALFIRIKNTIARIEDERGAAMAEYGLLLAMVALAAIGILVFFGGEILELFTEAEATVNDRGGPPGPD